ncbi:MAG: hypothetical protein WBG02_01545 [Candidatus Acidiferrum sp.]
MTVVAGAGFGALSLRVTIVDTEGGRFVPTIFASVAAGAHGSIDAAQRALCPEHRVVEADPQSASRREELCGICCELYFEFGKSNSPAISAGRVLPALRQVATASRGNA